VAFIVIRGMQNEGINLPIPKMIKLCLAIGLFAGKK
jgi:hypothetical protein